MSSAFVSNLGIDPIVDLSASVQSGHGAHEDLEAAVFFSPWLLFLFLGELLGPVTGR